MKCLLRRDARRDRISLRLRRARPVENPRSSEPYPSRLHGGTCTKSVATGRPNRESRPVRRQLQLARARSGCRSISCIIESLQKFHHYYGDDFKIECPTGSGKFLNLDEAAEEISTRLTRLFLKDDNGRRPVLKNYPKLANDPHFRDHVLFHEYFHGDTGRGLGASHQTGWTGLVAKLIMPRAGSHHPIDAILHPRKS